MCSVYDEARRREEPPHVRRARDTRGEYTAALKACGGRCKAQVGMCVPTRVGRRLSGTSWAFQARAFASERAGAYAVPAKRCSQAFHLPRSERGPADKRRAPRNPRFLRRMIRREQRKSFRRGGSRTTVAEARRIGPGRAGAHAPRGAKNRGNRARCKASSDWFVMCRRGPDRRDESADGRRPVVVRRRTGERPHTLSSQAHFRIKPPNFAQIDVNPRASHHPA